MTATVYVMEITGASGSKVYTTITSKVRLFSDDVATNQTTPQTTNPVVIPASGLNYSYWKAVCLYLTGTGFNINNIRHFQASGTPIKSVWALGTSGKLQRGDRDAGDKGCPDGDYAQSVGVAGTTGYAIDDVSHGHSYYLGQTTKTADVDSDTSGIVIDSATYTSANYTKHIVLQAVVDTNATQGSQTAVTLTWKYDEW